MIKAVLYDLDGTVINTNNLVISSWKHTLEKILGWYPGDKEIIASFGEPLVETAKRFGGDEADNIVKVYREHNLAFHDEMIERYVGMEDTIKELKAMGIKVGIVTSKMRKTAERALKLFNIYEFMDVIVTFDDTEKHKPDAEPLNKALGILNISPEDVIYVGDSRFDIQCGKNAGTLTCAVKYSESPLDELMKYKPDYLIDKPLDIIDIVKENLSDIEAV
ncbi:pyrophosphatase PpaX [Oxobacter pfennigii]|uniref:Pyrophosphatase PpaX n=1 Tax=Oxobacter pfennigii TaxID=36849 RepID=A0A0P8WCX2_9CLOT|nr:pyrophosphatase PpaX [Oxobacter pfennigii]KPU45699.1 pyrophosphatase PpaX [Oxobacter pfennigii]